MNYLKIFPKKLGISYLSLKTSMRVNSIQQQKVMFAEVQKENVLKQYCWNKKYRQYQYRLFWCLFIQFMPTIRRAKITDLHQMQNCNLWCLPENYHFNYYLYHYLTWSELLHVAEENGQVCGYVLAKMDDEPDSNQQAAHITSLSVLRTHRRLGLANKLMNFAHDSMELTQESDYVSLHVRVSNRAALGLYRDRLGYQVANTEVGYYADGENAYQMKKNLVRRGFPKAPPPVEAAATT